MRLDTSLNGHKRILLDHMVIQVGEGGELCSNTLLRNLKIHDKFEVHKN